MIFKNTYGCTLVLDVPNAEDYKEKFTGSSLERKKYRPDPPTKSELTIDDVKADNVSEN